jgi:gliding motility-associated-like protein
LELYFTGSNAESLVWDLGDGSVYSTESVMHIYENSGLYTVNLIAQNPPCSPASSSLDLEVIVLEESLTIAPNKINVITPNGDGVNDCLQFFDTELEIYIDEFKLSVFNRWGQLIHESTNPTALWCAHDLSEGTYFYILKYRDLCSEEEQVIQSEISVLR